MHMIGDRGEFGCEFGRKVRRQVQACVFARSRKERAHQENFD
jgi:hypothetical protein